MNTSTLNAFQDTMRDCLSSVYIEEPSQLHDDVSKSVWAWVKSKYDVDWSKAPILDVGCGCGVFLEMLLTEGRGCIGITASKEEFERCTVKSLPIANWEMQDVSQLSEYASGIWLRHTAEHSFAPYMLLRSCYKAIKPGGWIYLEVPAPGTSSKHEENANHFSVLGNSMWRQLLIRAGFEIVDTTSIQFETKLGMDEYFCFLGKKTI